MAKWEEFLSWFTEPARPGVYLLGTYSRYATLYSQQVRALNLVSALWETGAIARGTKVAVIGGGAAGLTASAAAAVLDAEVSLFERLPGLMELQRNNRQRWIHPHIYDWPAPDDESDAAGLPLLDWNAGYAEQVAERIEDEWTRIAKKTGRVKAHYPLTSIDVGSHPKSKQPFVVWNGPKGNAKDTFPVVIIAVGFGLEKRHDHQWSYWEEDSLDGGFRAAGASERWLISGYGDSALTDLMRLKIRRFRHGRLTDLFKGSKIDSVRRDLLEIHRDPKSEDAEFLTERFESLSTNRLEDQLDGNLREDVHVSLTGLTPFLYDPRASILNRLILLLLSRKRAFEHRLGPVAEGGVKRTEDGFSVQLASGRETFDRVLFRHGPEPSMEQSLNSLWQDTTALRNRWKALPRSEDRTRHLRWQYQLFNREQPRPVTAAFHAEAERVGVSARAVTASKEIFADGRALLRFKIHGLTLSRGELHGIRIAVASMTGKVGQIELDAKAQQLGIEWHDDPPPVAISADAPFRERLQGLRENGRRLSGTLRLAEPLTADGGSITFGFSVLELNADATTRWEFEQMYPPSEQHHIDGSDLNHCEYFARIVWFPVETLRIRLTFPDLTDEPALVPTYSVFKRSPDVPSDPITPDHILHLAPRPESRKAPADLGWQRIGARPDVRFKQAGLSPTWELSVTMPSMGECYALDWQVPEIAVSPEAAAIESEVEAVRKAMLDHGRGRRDGARGTVRPHLRTRFLELAAEVSRLYGSPREQERLALGLFAYDSEARTLRIVEGVVDGRDDIDPDWWDFELPFGVGLGGDAFKAGRPFIYVRPNTPSDKRFSSFVDVPGQTLNDIAMLFSIPLDDPRHEGGEDPGRQCFGVLDISTNWAGSRLLAAARAEGKVPDDLVAACYGFGAWLGNSLVIP